MSSAGRVSVADAKPSRPISTVNSRFRFAFSRRVRTASGSRRSTIMSTMASIRAGDHDPGLRRARAMSASTNAA
ncbi:hypothetical protein RhoFasK5_03487|nr:hypothetical protein [Rhodococcus kroppenstedtii]